MKDEKQPTSRSYHSYLIESLQDPEKAAAYVEAVLEEREPKLLLLALRDVAEARASMAGGLAELHQKNLENLLSNPEISGLYHLLALLDELGLQLSVTASSKKQSLSAKFTQA